MYKNAEYEVVEDEPETERAHGWELVGYLLSTSEKSSISDELVEFVTEVGKGIITAELMITKMTKLQQICGGTVLDDKGKSHVVGDEKAAEALHLIEEGAGSTLIWCQFKEELAALWAMLTKEGYGTAIYSGDTSLEDRMKHEEDFQAERLQILLLQNLQH